MRLTFTKRSGKHDDLLFERPGQPIETIQCPKQGIIPHDMVHYAVEKTLEFHGFLSLVAEGKAAGFATSGGDSEEAIERLVETFQAEMWGERAPAVDLIAVYEHACVARGHKAMPVSAPNVEAIRLLLDELTDKWANVPLNASLALQI